MGGERSISHLVVGFLSVGLCCQDAIRLPVVSDFRVSDVIFEVWIFALSCWNTGLPSVTSTCRRIMKYSGNQCLIASRQ